jgi:uncharacterized protein (TIGR02246 family)
MDGLEQLLAMQAIRDQILRYAIFLDDKNWDELAKLWTEDAVWAGPGMEFTGRDGVMEFLSGCLPDDYSGKHLNAPSLIELTGPDSAHALTDVVWIAQDFEIQVAARYDDDVVRVDGTWLFVRRTEIVLPFRHGGPPMSDTALELSEGTMRPVSGPTR